MSDKHTQPDEQPENENPQQEPDDDNYAPQFVPTLSGRTISFHGLIERIVEEYQLEHGENASNPAQEAASDAEKRMLVRDVAEYIIAVESVQLTLKEKARVIARSYGELFGYGPLDELFTDETVTTIALEGTEKVAIRHAPGTELKMLEPMFEDLHHLRATVNRLLRDANAELRDDSPIIEAGLEVEGRKVSVSVIAPPLVIELAADIRVHPKQLPSLDNLVQSNVMNAQAAELLKAIAASEHGFLIVGDTESGKTTLLSILTHFFPNPSGMVAVERAGELILPDEATSLVPQWRSPQNDEQITFGERIQEGLALDPSTIILDEVRADEPLTITSLLNQEDVPRQVWSFRGASESMRIRASLGTLARMCNKAAPEAMVYNLYERLPFIIVIKRRRGYLQLREIAEWQFPDDYKERNEMVYAEYVPLMAAEWDDCQPTGNQPRHALNLPDDFWTEA